MKLVFALLAALAVSAVPAGAVAEPLRLDYAADGTGCLDAGRFRDEVAARLGESPFNDAALSVVRVRIAVEGDGFTGTLEMQGSEVRAFRDAQCAALVETIASALATRLGAKPVAPTVAPSAAAALPLDPPPTVTVRQADPIRSSWLSGGLSFSQIRRSSSAAGFRAALGFERRVATVASVAARVGVARHADGLGSSSLPYVGVHAFWWSRLGASADLKLGGGVELWLNSASETGIQGEPVFLHVLGEIGPRLHLNETWALEIPIELGVMPYFSPKIYTLQIGAQLAHAL